MLWRERKHELLYVPQPTECCCRSARTCFLRFSSNAIAAFFSAFLLIGGRVVVEALRGQVVVEVVGGWVVVEALWGWVEEVKGARCGDRSIQRMGGGWSVQKMGCVYWWWLCVKKSMGKKLLVQLVCLRRPLAIPNVVSKVGLPLSAWEWTLLNEMKHTQTIFLKSYLSSLHT